MSLTEPSPFKWNLFSLYDGISNNRQHVPYKKKDESTSFIVITNNKRVKCPFFKRVPVYGTFKSET